MDTDQFERQVQAFRNRLNRLKEVREGRLDDETQILEQAFQELNVGMEELQVTEEELRQQYEELSLSREIIEAERHRYQDLFENAPDGYIITDLHGKILEVNRAASVLLNVPQAAVKGKYLSLFVDLKQQDKLRELMAQALNIRRLDQWETQMRTLSKLYFDAVVSFTVLAPMEGNPAAIRWAIRDISERKRAEQAVFQSEQRFRTIFNHSDLAIALVNDDGKIIEANPALQAMLGQSHDQLYSHDISRFFQKDTVQEGKEKLASLLAGRVDHYKQETRLRNYLDEDVWVHLTASTFHLDDPLQRYAIVMFENINEQKSMQAQMDEIRKRLIIGGERERHRLSQDLHDGPLQDLYGIFFQLNLLLPRVENQEIARELSKNRDALQQVIERLRMTSYELRPPALLHYGLAKAILSYSERFKAFYSGVNIYLDLANDDKKLSEEVRLCLFRNYQQAMTNIFHHSNAKNVWIVLNLYPNEIILEIKDDGKGFQPPNHWIDLVREGHLGLAGSAERAEALGGRLEIESERDQGAAIRTILPLKNGQHPRK